MSHGFLEFLRQRNTSKKQLICEGGADGHLHHIWETDKITFSDLKDIFTKLFTDQIMISEKTDGQNLNVTVVDGETKFARNQATIKSPMSIQELAKKFDGRGELTKAFVDAATDIDSALSQLSEKELYNIFKNGENFMSLEIIFPGTKNVIDYGGKSLIQFHGLNKFDQSGRRVGQDKDSAKKLYDLLDSKNLLTQKHFKLSGPTVLKLKNTVSAKEALDEILSDLHDLVDGIGYSSTLSDYVKERYEKKIINAGIKSGITKISRGSKFVSELADRLSKISGRKPTKADLATYAKAEGINTKSPEYREFLDEIEASLDTDNTEILLPIEKLVVKAGTLLIQNLSGFISADRNASAQRLSKDLDLALEELKNNQEKLTPAKLQIFIKNLRKLDQFGKTPTGVEGIVFVYDGKPMKLTANFGPINQLLGLFRY